MTQIACLDFLKMDSFTEFQTDSAGQAFISSIVPPATDIEGLAFDSKTLYASTASGSLHTIDPAISLPTMDFTPIEFTVPGGPLFGLAARTVLGGVASTTETRLVDSGDEWRFLDDGSDQGTAWIAADFDDSGWSTGISELGYGDGDEATELDFGGNPDTKFTTTYFRRDFTVFAATAVEELRLGLLRDDAAAVYLNGVEVVRDNLEPNALFDAFAIATVSNQAEAEFLAFNLDPNILVDGTNTLAVEVHQRSLTSSDLSFDLTLDIVETSEAFELPPISDMDFYSLDMTNRVGDQVDIIPVR